MNDITISSDADEYLSHWISQLDGLIIDRALLIAKYRGASTVIVSDIIGAITEMQILINISKTAKPLKN